MTRAEQLYVNHRFLPVAVYVGIIVLGLGTLFWDQVWSFQFISVCLGVGSLGLLSRVVPEIVGFGNLSPSFNFLKGFDLALLALFVLASQAPAPLLSLGLFLGGVWSASLTAERFRLAANLGLMTLGWVSLLLFSSSSGLTFIFELIMVFASLALGAWIAAGEPVDLSFSAFDRAPFGLMAVGSDDRIIWANSWLNTWFNSETKGKRLGELFSGLDLSKLEGSKVFDYTMEGLTPTLEDGGSGPRFLDLTCFTDERSGLRILQIEDKTEANSYLAKQKESEQLMILGAAVATLAHEIKNPLTSLSGAVELLNEGAKEPTDKKLIGILSTELKRLLKLTQDILGFSKLKALDSNSNKSQETQSIDLKELLKETVDLFKLDTAISKGIDIKMGVDGQLLKFQGDQDGLKQVFLNLLQNSGQALQKTATKKIEIEAKMLDLGIEVTLQDSGPGITDADLPKLFEPFWTSKNKGTGLGLMVAKQIVESHGGSIKAQQGVLGGACFVIHFPLSRSSN